jgi:NitT/TauT family transport system ATP-binding protein
MEVQLKEEKEVELTSTEIDAGPAVALTDVSHTFTGARRGAPPTEVLRGVSFTLEQSNTLAVVGPSGCGKTTLLEMICGLLEPTSGTVSALPAALTPQRDLLLPWLSAIDNAALPLRLKGESRQAASEQTEPWFERFGLAGFEAAPPDQLSGGMRHRVSFLRSLLAGKPLLALDEPFASLDAITRAEMQSWLAHTLSEEPRTVVLVTHDVEEAVVLADRLLVLSPRPGRVIADIPVDLPHPRHRTDRQVTEIRAHALEQLGLQR